MPRWRLVGRCAVRLLDDHLVPEVERDGGDVEAGAEVRARRRCADVDGHAATASGILQPVAGDDADDALARLRRLRQPRDSGRGRALAEDPLLVPDLPPRLLDLVVGDGDDRAAGAGDDLLGLGAVHRIDDADGRGVRVGAIRRLHGMDARQRAGRLLEAARIRARVAAAAVGERQHRGQAAELLDDLDRRGLLTFDAVVVAARVDEHGALLRREPLGLRVRVRERSVNLDDASRRRRAPARASSWRRRR